MSKVLIYKESALDILDDFQSDIENCVPNAYATARQRVSGLYPRNPDWIPCSERLPNENEWVLCSCNDGFAILILKLKGKVWHKTESTEYLPKFVNAWMPLPEPWKGSK